jgi:hypothetical protein
MCLISVVGSSKTEAATKECTVIAEVAVSNDENQVVARLKKGDHVYIDFDFGPDWFNLYSFDGKSFPELGHAVEGIDCAGPQDETYPVIFDNARQLFDAVGLAADLHADPISASLKKCFLYIPEGGGSLNVALSEEFLEPYEKAGYPFDNLCMVLKSGQVRFDPETGERLPTYFVSGDGFATEFTMIAPPCFAKGKFTQPQSFLGRLQPLGCQVKYHPWSGRELSLEESKAYTETGYLIVSGEAGTVLEDITSLANDPKKRVSGAKIDALRSVLGR